MRKLDRLDLHLLKHLQQDARQSLRKLSSLLRVPHTTLFSRAERLLKRGIIKRFAAILHPHELGLEIYVVVIETPPSRSKDLALRLAEMDEVMKVFRTYDGKVITKLIVPEAKPEGLEEFLVKVNHFPTTVYQVRDVIKYEHSLPVSILEELFLKK